MIEDDVNSSYDSNITCTYIEEEYLCHIFHDTSYIMHWNIQGVVRKFSYLTSCLTECVTLPSIIGLCETFMTSDNCNKYDLNGYIHHYSIRNIKRRGGLSLYISDNINSKTRDDLKTHTEGVCESLVVELELKDVKNIIVCELYRVPNSNPDYFYQAVRELCTNVRKEKKRLIIMTDQNINVMNDNHVASIEVLDLMMHFNMLPLITLPTRVTNTSSTLIDNVYVGNELYPKKSFLLEVDYSDHYPCFVEFYGTSLIKLDTIEEYQTRKINQEKIDKFKFDLLNVDLPVDCTDEVITAYVSHIQSSFEKHMPLEYKTNRRQICSDAWFDKTLLDKIKAKNKSYKKFKANELDWSVYKTIRNECKKAVREAKKTFFTERLKKFRSESRVLWGLLNNLTRRKKSKSDFPKEFLINNLLCSDKKKIACTFAEYYANLGENLAEKVREQRDPNTVYNTTPKTKIVSENIFLYPTTEKEIIEIVNDLKSKKSSGIDCICNFMLKEIIDSLSLNLCKMINCTLDKGFFPSVFKTAKVMPLFKKGNPKIVNNYRPISLLSCISKVFEKVMLKRLTKFINKHNVLYEGQYGFRKNRSTVDACLDLVGNIITELEKNNYTIGIFLDMSRAFDTIKLSILLKKLEHYGIRGIAQQWIASYLCDRKLKVIFENTESNIESINTGSPQGANLSPFLYILYTNCVFKELRFCSTLLFADDTNLFISGKNIRWMKSKIKHDIIKIQNYFIANELTLNLSKTCVILFRKAQWQKLDLNLYIGNTHLEQVSCTKFLGLYLDETLKWDVHVEQLIKKIRSGMYSLAQAKNIANLEGKLLLYYAFVHSHLTYGISLWYQCNKYLKKRVRQKQIDCMKIIFNTNSRTECMSNMKKFKIVSLDVLSQIEYCKISYRYTSNLLSKRIVNLFENRENTKHHYQTRNRTNPQPIRFKSTLYQNSFLVRSPHCYLNISYNTRYAKSITNFKNRIKRELLS